MWFVEWPEQLCKKNPRKSRIESSLNSHNLVKPYQLSSHQGASHFVSSYSNTHTVYVIYLKCNILSQSIKAKVRRFTKENFSSRYGVVHFWSVVAALATFHLVSSIPFEIEPKQCLSS